MRWFNYFNNPMSNSSSRASVPLLLMMFEDICLIHSLPFPSAQIHTSKCRCFVTGAG